jgi:hypothetical protein
MKLRQLFTKPKHSGKNLPHFDIFFIIILTFGLGRAIQSNESWRLYLYLPAYLVFYTMFVFNIYFYYTKERP